MSLDWTSGISPRRAAQEQRMASFCRAQSWSEILLLTSSSLSLLLRISNHRFGVPSVRMVDIRAVTVHAEEP